MKQCFYMKWHLGQNLDKFVLFPWNMVTTIAVLLAHIRSHLEFRIGTDLGSVAHVRTLYLGGAVLDVKSAYERTIPKEK